MALITLYPLDDMELAVMLVLTGSSSFKQEAHTRLWLYLSEGCFHVCY